MVLFKDTHKTNVKVFLRKHTNYLLALKMEGDGVGAFVYFCTILLLKESRKQVLENIVHWGSVCLKCAA